MDNTNSPDKLLRPVDFSYPEGFQAFLNEVYDDKPEETREGEFLSFIKGLLLY